MKQKIYLLTTSFLILFGLANFAFADYKIKQQMTASGQRIESTVYVKGSRQRTQSGGMMGMGADVATIEQCDLKRNVQINDNKKLYFIDPFAASEDDTSGGGAATNVSNEKVIRGGVVTMTYSINDTGERKQMFGLTARHIKTVMTMQSSPDACSKDDMRIETDGWYVDLPQFSCPIQVPRNPVGGMGARGGCQDRFVTKQTGSGKLGFPLTETRTMSGMGGSDMTFTQTIETLDFSTAALDAGLFDVPKDYTLAKSSEDLYGKPDMSAMMRNMGGNNNNSSMPTQNTSMPVGAKSAGVTRIGVLAISNSSGQSVSTENLRQSLIGSLTSGNVEAVPVSSDDDAKMKSCDYVLSVDVSKLKQSAANKIGGMFGRATGVPTGATGDKFEVQIDYKLTMPDGQVKAQNKAVQKADGSADTATQAVLAQAAPKILDAVNQKQ
ncbi:MAG: hypothetical protein ACR2N3_17070 [Pyrinomonadaceae bacterium]